MTRDGSGDQSRRSRWRANPARPVKVNEIVDDSIVVELEKEGFIDRIYK